MTGPADLVPVTLYSPTEAKEAGVLSGEDWRHYRFTYPLQNLFREAMEYKGKVGPEVAFPCGNIVLSNGKHFLDNSNKSWLENQYWGDDEGDDPYQAFIITRMERDEFNNLKALVCVGIPTNINNDAIVVFVLIDGDQAGPLYSKVSEQPEGWLEQALKYDGKPPSQAAEEKPADKPEEKPADKPEESKPADKPAENK